MEVKPTKIPVTVLTGFLGSGKTTLLNRILTEQHGKKIAVIENEFGEVGVDNELVIGADEEIFEMNNGCICCTVRGDLIRILGNLSRRKDKLDYILIETTGLADPGPVAQTFFMDEDMQDNYQIDGIVTMVDARHVWHHIDDSDECQQQIAFADVLLLNKTDLVTPDELDQLEARIRSMNSQARIVRTQHADTPIDTILNVKAFDLTEKVAINPDFLTEELPYEAAGIYAFNGDEYQLLLDQGPDETMDVLLLKLPNLSDESIEKAKKKAVILFSDDPEMRKPNSFLKTTPTLNQLRVGEGSNTFRFRVSHPGLYMLFTQHGPDEFAMRVEQRGVALQPYQFFEYAAGHTHDDSVTSVGIEQLGDVDLKKLNQWLSVLLQTKGTDIFRSKGILSIHGHAERFVFQGVHMLFDSSADRAWRAGEIRRNQLVFIGRNLDREQLTKGFASCLYKEGSRLRSTAI